MSTPPTTPPPAAVPPATANKLGLAKNDYKGAPSTLCTGCGHDSITNHIITSFYELNINPWDVAKMSGIGCSSKTPAYFMSQAHGFNAVHGRMPSVATGAKLANNKLNVIAVSGDGDTASIGIGQFAHLVRRNLDMVYLIENNGVYGLTKGQFSATADKNSKQKYGASNPFEGIDICSLALDLGCSFVARSFSGDAKQLVPLIKAAMSHKGTAVIDVISPCVTFNNHEGSTRSYNAVKEKDDPLHEIGYVPSFTDIRVEFEPGTMKEVQMPDGSFVTLKKLNHDYDPTNKTAAINIIQEARASGALITGLYYINEKNTDLSGNLALPESALGKLSEKDLRPAENAMAEIMKEFV